MDGSVTLGLFGFFLGISAATLAFVVFGFWCAHREAGEWVVAHPDAVDDECARPDGVVELKWAPSGSTLRLRANKIAFEVSDNG